MSTSTGPVPYNTTMTRTCDVAVIGGGIIGLTTAYTLAQEGAKVVVVDRGALGQEASWAGAGIIPPLSQGVGQTAYDQLRVRSVAAYPALSMALLQETGIDNEYHTCGGIEYLEENADEIAAAWKAEPIPFEELTPAELRDFEPATTTVNGTRAFALAFNQVRNPLHLLALVKACRKRGVQFLTDSPVETWDLKPHKAVSFIIHSSERVSANTFVVCAGAWANGVLKPFNIQIPVAPIRGQIVMFQPAKPILKRILIVGKRYLVPRKDGRVLVGSTEEPEAGFQKENTPAGIEGLIDFAKALVPALATVPVERTWAGLRPGSADGLPFIGPVPGFINVLAAVGHFRAGVQLSPGTAELVTNMVFGRPSPLPLEAFRLDREPAKDYRPAFRS